MHQRDIRLAWEAFLKNGRTPHAFPLAVATSWERSRNFGVGAGWKEAPLAGEPEIFLRRSKIAELLRVARPALERSSEFLSDARSMMVLTDASGFIVETAGDPRVVDEGRRNHLQIGGRWAEGVIGTNAIGTALAERRPIQICGAEHFCADVQRWTCAAKPICHPVDGELLGIVDISGPAASYNPQSLALAVSIGQEIEASLGRAAKLEHEALLRRFVAKRSIWLSDDILLVDRRGAVVHATEKAIQKLDDKAAAQEFGKIIGGATPAAWEENCRRRFPNARIEIVHSEGEAIGCLVVIPQPRAHKASSSVRAAVETTVAFDEIVGSSEVMRTVCARARKLAASPLPILIEGETGVGKELFARAIKSASFAMDGPLVPVNCGGMARDLIASELFGYAKGAFTGADDRGRPGKIEMADGGVLCLDEIGEMPLDLQSYLLRVLEDGVVYRVGDHEGRRVNFRLVSMTNRDLVSEVEAGRFRRDLYYRIAATRIRVPPLRERQEDVAQLAMHFVAVTAKRQKCGPISISNDALEILAKYLWPGNVRELRNVIESMVALSDGDVIDVGNIPPELLVSTQPLGGDSAKIAPAIAPVERHSGDLKAQERSAIIAQVEACNGNLTEAARRLGIARSTLYVRLQQYGANRPSKA
ncbi:MULTISPECIES: sigma-54-dependent Fis family transcriptional regulator [unclassified Hyphomicrobium]|uniref:sigma-54-dependent Fis family transcriptional regulator n=1 Tax=unclassified Hyphomicrobium TaxID=2619925 RepID=UPI000213F771|nr:MULTISPECIES: sigma-54-dependent Fis family transcriptional regulator [unclassified Hyphomicrobium]CCB63710.1 acetone carboxylase transcriptional regulator [Hyphomicrobium sp. MC1]